MINRSRVTRWALAGGVILSVGAAAGAATKLKRASAGDACLCTPDTQDAASLGVAARATTAPGTSFARGNGIVPSSATRSGSAGALAPFIAASGPAFWNTRAAVASRGNAGGAGWMSNGRNVGAYSSSSNHRVGALGGLWRMMNFARHASPESTHASAGLKPVSKNPNRSPSNGNGKGNGNGGGSGVPGGSTPVQPPLFGGPIGTIGELIDCGPIHIPGIGGSGGGGGGTGAGPGLATTPEPGSIFLLGTGVLGLFGMLRRRALQ